MTITLEYYRIVLMVALVLLILKILSEFAIPLGTQSLLLSTLLYAIASYGALIALTNINKGYVKAFWKKENKYLRIPFQNGKPIIALDDDGNRYKMRILLIPKAMNS